MMPLRKMRSKSLAVVELVLSLSVSRAWCMATHTQTQTQTEKSERTAFYFSPHFSLFNSNPWETDFIRMREGEGESTFCSSLHYMDKREEVEGEVSRRNKGWELPPIFPKQFHLCPSPFY